MSNKTHNDISYKKSQSDRLYELLNQKTFNPQLCNGTSVQTTVSEISNNSNYLLTCNTEEPSTLCRKKSMCYSVNGKSTSILNTNSAMSSSDNSDKLKTHTITSTCSPCVNYNKPWNNQSDRDQPHAGGVDVKNGSYQRYLAKLKL